MATYLRGLDLPRDFPASSALPHPANTPIAYGSGPGAKIATGLRVPPTVSFTGGSLPDGWTVDTGTGGSYTMVGDRIRLGITSGTSKDSIFPGSTVDNSVGPVGVCPDIDFDVAVQVGTDIHVLRGVGFGIFVKVGAATWLRASWYCNGGSNGGFSNLVRTEYSAFSTDGSTVTQVTGSNAPTGNLFDGGPSWFRLKRAGSTWTSYVSGDGITWLQERTWTAAITGVSAIKFGLMNTTTTTPAKSFDLFQVVDLAAQPDNRPAWVKTSHTNTVSTDFSSGSLPTWLTTYTGTSGTAGVVSNKLHMTNRADLDRSYAAVASNRTPTADQGLLCQIQYGTTSGQSFFDPGVAGNGTGVGVTDQYSPAGGNTYIIEMPSGSATGNHVRAVRRTASTDAYTFYSMATTAGNGFESAYTHYLGDSTTSTVTYTSPIWLRLEYADGRFRCKWWQGLLTDEPGTWLFDGADQISQSASGGVQSLNWAHNDTSGATSGSIDTADVLYVEMYDLASSVVPAATGSLTLGGSGAATVSAASTGTLTLGATTTATASASATGTLSLSGSASAQTPATSTGTVTLGGTAAASAPATTTGSLTLGGTATAGATAPASGTLVLSGTAIPKGAGAALGTVTLGGAAAAAVQVGGTGSLTLGGASTATTPVAATGTLTLTGTATSTVTGSATGSLTLSGTASTAARSAAVGVLTLTGSAAATPAGVAIGSLTLGGTAAFQAPPAAGLLTLTGTAAPQVPDSAAGTLSLTGTTTATVFVVAAGSLTLGGTVTAIGTAFSVGTLTLTGTGTGQAPAAASGTLTLGGTSHGTGPGNFATGQLSLTGTATPAATGATLGGLVLTGAGIPAATANAALGSLTLAGAATGRVPAAATGGLTLTASAAASLGSPALGAVTLGGSSAAAAAGFIAGLLSFDGLGTGAGSSSFSGSLALTGNPAARVTAAALGSLTLGGQTAGNNTLRGFHVYTDSWTPRQAVVWTGQRWQPYSPSLLTRSSP